MPTTLEIDCNGSIKTQSINHSICRIGSNPGLELSMPGLEGHVATLRIQNGKRQVFNRSSKSIKLNGKSVRPEQTIEWSANQILELAEGVSLRLLSAKDESRVNLEKTVGQENTLAQNTTAKSRIADQKQRRMAILGFFLAFATILYSSDSSEAQQAMDQEFAGVVDALIKAERAPNSGLYRQVRIELQNAILKPDSRSQSIRNIEEILVKNEHKLDSAIGKKVGRFLAALS